MMMISLMNPALYSEPVSSKCLVSSGCCDCWMVSQEGVVVVPFYWSTVVVQMVIYRSCIEPIASREEACLLWWVFRKRLVSNNSEL